MLEDDLPSTSTIVKQNECRTNTGLSNVLMLVAFFSFSYKFPKIDFCPDGTRAMSLCDRMCKLKEISVVYTHSLKTVERHATVMDWWALVNISFDIAP